MTLLFILESEKVTQQPIKDNNFILLYCQTQNTLNITLSKRQTNTQPTHEHFQTRIAIFPKYIYNRFVS
eukprot:m.112094 g.112094  ORF g.112094 m.112094 type:complete len:69 (-) comp12776_c4_seq2:543-749(-)